MEDYGTYEWANWTAKDLKILRPVTHGDQTLWLILSLLQDCYILYTLWKNCWVTWATINLIDKGFVFKVIVEASLYLWFVLDRSQPHKLAYQIQNGVVLLNLEKVDHVSTIHSNIFWVQNCVLVLEERIKLLWVYGFGKLCKIIFESHGQYICYWEITLWHTSQMLGSVGVSCHKSFNCCSISSFFEQKKQLSVLPWSLLWQKTLQSMYMKTVLNASSAQFPALLKNLVSTECGILENCCKAFWKKVYFERLLLNTCSLKLLPRVC